MWECHLNLFHCHGHMTSFHSVHSLPVFFSLLSFVFVSDSISSRIFICVTIISFWWPEPVTNQSVKWSSRHILCFHQFMFPVNLFFQFLFLVRLGVFSPPFLRWGLTKHFPWRPVWARSWVLSTSCFIISNVLRLISYLTLSNAAFLFFPLYWLIFGSLIFAFSFDVVLVK